MDEPAATDPHPRLAQSTIGRVVIGAFVTVAALWIVGPNIPAGPFRDQIDVLWRPATEIGLVQDWAVFSPDPRDQSLDVRARVEFDDGTEEMWDVPEHGPVIGAYRQYRWQKWQERVRLDARSWMWDTTAEWIADRYPSDEQRVVRVVLIRRWIDHEPVGSPRPIDGDWNEFEFHEWTPGP